MLDIGLIREQYNFVKTNLERRRDDNVMQLLAQVKEWDEEWRKADYKVRELVSEKNKLSQSINAAKKAGKDVKSIIEAVGKMKSEIESANMIAEDMRLRRDGGLMRLPNLLADDVPYGKDDTENEEVRVWGEIKDPGFTLKPHSEVVEELGVADFDRARKISGAGFNFMKGDLVLLHQGLIRFAMDKLIEKGFVPVEVPLMMRRDAYEGVTDVHDFEDVMYKNEGEDEYWIATSEHPLVAQHKDEVIREEDLPIRYVGISQCFRREIGAHGIDEKGFFRMHQFYKIEQVAFCTPEESGALHEELVANAEELFRALKIPYHVVNICTGDLGTVAAKKYDIEAWMPRSKEYKEVVSGSNCTDYQARRLNIKCGDQGGDKRYLHTLNCTGVATSRALVAIIEHYQQADGTILVPSVLVPYVGKDVISRIS